jgi:hypothetical protein
MSTLNAQQMLEMARQVQQDYKRQQHQYQEGGDPLGAALARCAAEAIAALIAQWSEPAP